MTEYTEIVGQPQQKENHKRKSNPLNSRSNTTKWLSSTLKTGIKQSDLTKKEVMKIAENAVEEAKEA